HQQDQPQQGTRGKMLQCFHSLLRGADQPNIDVSMFGSLPGPWICDRVAVPARSTALSQNLWARQIYEGRFLSRDCEDEALRDLMVQYQEGSLEAFRELYAHLAPDLRRYVRFLTRGSDAADDLLQAPFAQLHRSRAAYNPAYAVRPWMFGLARNVCLMNRRAMRRWANIHAVGSDLPDVPVPAEVDRLADADAIRQCLAELPADHAEALT